MFCFVLSLVVLCIALAVFCNCLRVLQLLEGFACACVLRFYLALRVSLEVVWTAMLCRARRSKLSHGRRCSRLERTPPVSTSLLPSFDLGMELGSPESVSVSPNVSKRAKSGKRVSVAEPVGVIVGGVLSEIYTSLQPTLIDVPCRETDSFLLPASDRVENCFGAVHCASYGVQEPSDSFFAGSASDCEENCSAVLRCSSYAVEEPLDIVHLHTSDGRDNCFDSEIFVSEIPVEDEMAGGLDEIELSIIDEPVDDRNDETMPLSESDERSDALVDRISESIVVPINSESAIVERSIESPVDIVNEAGFDLFDEASFDKEMCSNQKSGTTKSNSWVKNRFNAWREASKLDTSVPLEEIPLRELSELLCRFFYCLKNKKGKHYPSQSVMQIYKGFNRMFCGVQREWINSARRFVLFATSVFFVRGNTELWKLRAINFYLGTDKCEREMLKSFVGEL